jgi:uncharacterized protein YvpB
VRRLPGFVLLCAVLLSACGTVQASRLETPSTSETLTPTPTVTPQPTATFTITCTATITPTVTATLPLEAYIKNFNAHRQAYALSCEAAAAVDWAQYFGVSIYESDFQHELPLSDNPDLGFVGTKNAPWGQIPPYAYGVHAGPVAAVLQAHGVSAVAVKGFTLEQLEREIASGQPVIAWVIGNCVSATPVIYTDSQGNSVTVAPYEHVIIIVGYGEGRIRYYSAGQLYETPVDVFARSWAVLGNMVVYFGD